MEVERPQHHHNNSTSELLICFTSRLSSSSSMKLTSKSILSPGRNREPSQISLSTSLSRRLRNNGSIKGGNGQASPMFPTTTGKKRGCAFENPEPSSPKVTCIGQVRVKTKKQGKKMRAARSKKRRGGEASFRKTEQGFSSDLQNLQQAEAGLTHRNQRWVHLPLTICEALRTFGAEFSCLFPCRSSSCGGGGGAGREKEGEEKVQGKGEGSGGGQSREASCGAAFARWLVALQEGEGKGREIELVVGEENEEVEEEDDRPERSRRRHVFEDIEIDIEKNDEEEDKARVSICIPPKNALLLMRCRSDPVKVAALANRFWESPAPKDEVEQDDELQEQQKEDNDEERVHMEEEEDEEKQDRVQVPAVEEDSSICELSNEKQEVPEAEAELVIEACESEIPTTPEISEVAEAIEEKQEVQEEEEKEKEVDEIEVEESYNNGNVKDENLHDNWPKVPADLEKPELEECHEENLQEEEENGEDFCGDELKISELASSSPVISEASESENNEEEEKADISVTPETPAREATVESAEKEEEEKETEERPREDESTVTHDRLSDREYPKADEPKHGPVLPDCLLLMMCEPKLSMEVSKETWVCSTDFVRWLPERPAKIKDGGDEPKKRISVDAKPPLGPPQPIQPPRSSCSFPAPTAAGGRGMSMANMIEQKLVGSNAYEPFVLTRCKSEPMRSSAKFAAPDACFWKNRKLEPHHCPATLGVGAAGVGF